MIFLAAFLLPGIWCCSIDPTTPAYAVNKEVSLAMSTSSAAQLTPEESLFVSVPSNDSARASLKFITSRPHVAGTPGDYAMAQYVQKRFVEAGIRDAVIDPHTTLLAYPLNRSFVLVDDTGKVVWKAPLAEKVMKSDSTSDTWWRNHSFNSYSPSGDATAPIVYANFGRPEDFAELEAAGVRVEGSIALMRYGKNFRGLKAENAERAGAVAALIYSDPEQDGYARGSVYPHGPWRPESSVQRGSIQFISTCAGDPARAYSPHGLTVKEVCGVEQDDLIPKIPVLPLSYGDAVPILEALEGEEAPLSFRGALNITYRTGPSKKLHGTVQVHNHFQKSPVWNVIATIPGSLPEEHDHPVILGNHRDAWVYGAADPNSGTSQLLEVALGLGALLKTGWRPLRSIILCSWSGEEYGLLGSTAWAEVHGDSSTGQVSKTGFLARALAYLNVDTGASGTEFHVSATPSLGEVLLGVLGQVKVQHSQRTVAEEWQDTDQSKIHALGSGSDYTAFIDHLGIPSLDMAFGHVNGSYGVYHSVYDSFAWMETEGDPGFHYSVAMSQIWGLLALRLSGTTKHPQKPIPFNVTLQAEAIGGYITDIQEELNVTTRPYLDFSPLSSAHEAFAKVAKSTMDVIARLLAEPPSSASTARIVSVNDRLALLERHFLTTEGLPGRKWFRHVLQAPGQDTGYAPITLPGIYDSIHAGRWVLAQAQIQAAAERVNAAAAFLSGGAFDEIVVV